MSKLKNPRAKKTASLVRDHRNDPGESGKTARKSTPSAKARTQRAHRRAVHQALAHAEPLADDRGVEVAETSLSKAARDRKAQGFRKKPDVPLGEYLERKHTRRVK